MTIAAFLFAALALLGAPGPTNTLLALAGAQGGWWRAARLIPAEILGYVTTILPLAIAGAATFQRWPLAALALKGAAAVWVLYLAVVLWRMSDRTDGTQPVSFARVYLTTVLNPKAFVVGLILIPGPGSPDFQTKLALFFLTVPLVAALWSAGGALAARHGSRVGPITIQRAASLCLMILSGTLTASLLGA